MILRTTMTNDGTHSQGYLSLSTARETRPRHPKYNCLMQDRGYISHVTLTNVPKAARSLPPRRVRLLRPVRHLGEHRHQRGRHARVPAQHAPRVQYERRARRVAAQVAFGKARFETRIDVQGQGFETTRVPGAFQLWVRGSQSAPAPPRGPPPRRRSPSRSPPRPRSPTV
jgi:hypothetical protein